MSSILQAIARHAEDPVHPVAIRSAAESVSYASLQQSIVTLSNRLRVLNVKTAAIFLPNGIDWIITDLACLAANISVVPFPSFFSESQLNHMLADAKPDAIFVAHDNHIFAEKFDRVIEISNRCQLLANNESRSDATVMGSKISYTSGTTGQPKPVVLPYELINQACLNLNKSMSDVAVQRHLSILPYSNLRENIAGLYLPLIRGITVYAESMAAIGLRQDFTIDRQQFTTLLSQVSPDSLLLTPALLRITTDLVEAKLLNLKQVRFVAVGGAHTPPDLIKRARRNQLPVYEGYGLTEMASVSILNTPTSDRVGSVGKPLSGVKATLNDDGELVLDVAYKSVKNDAKVKHYHSIKTGDYASIDSEGFVSILGRKSNVIVLSSGRNVSPEWLESEVSEIAGIKQSLIYSTDGDSLKLLVLPGSNQFNNTHFTNQLEILNQKLPGYAALSSWMRISKPFGFSNGMLTSNGRPKRLEIMQQLSDITVGDSHQLYPRIKSACISAVLEY